MRLSDKGEEHFDTEVRGNGCDALLYKCFDAPEAVAHTDSRPDGPFEGQTAAVRILALKLFGETSEPFVGKGVIAFARETGAADDGTECDEEPESLRVQRGKDIAEAVELRGQGVLKVG